MPHPAVRRKFCGPLAKLALLAKLGSLANLAFLPFLANLAKLTSWAKLAIKMRIVAYSLAGNVLANFSGSRIFALAKPDR